MYKDNIEILIPTFNEADNIEQVIKELNDEGYYKITILDANSKDNTVEIAKKYDCKIILDDTTIKGFGGSVINGLNNLSCEYFCIFDGDNSFNPRQISEMYDKVNSGHDFVFASRYLNHEKSEDDTLFTKFGNYFFTKLVRIFFQINTSDVLFLYVLGKKSNVKKLNLVEKDYSICTEFIIKAYKEFECTEILSKERKRLHGDSKVNKVLAGLTLLINIIRLRIIY
tara:strand:- start:69 stop:746 length:678 start_codon:yes stop_codon:yes gene_type:complete